MKDFDLEKLERKNIYRVPDNLFENIQEKVMNEVKANKKAPIFKLNWGYAVAASLALIFGAAFVYNLNTDSTKNQNTDNTYASNIPATKKESQVAYETLKSDLTSIENNNQIVDNQQVKAIAYVPNDSKNNETSVKKTSSVSKQTEAQMTEYLDSFSNAEIAELAKNSTQDVYLDLYN